MSNPTATFTWATYLDFEEAWQYLQFDVAPTGPDAIKLQRFIDSACTQAQGPAGANRPLAPTRIKERHDGWSGEYIMLLFSPIIQFISCVEHMSTGGPITLPEVQPGSGSEGVRVEYETGRLMRTFDGTWPKPFFPGALNIEIVYDAGFNPVPPDVWEATMELVAYKWRSSQEAPRWFTGGSDDTYGGPQTNMLYPGVPNRIAEVFQSYRLPTIG